MTLREILLEKYRPQIQKTAITLTIASEVVAAAGRKLYQKASK
jgi:hypothetical protein